MIQVCDDGQVCSSVCYLEYNSYSMRYAATTTITTTTTTTTTCYIQDNTTLTVDTK